MKKTIKKLAALLLAGALAATAALPAFAANGATNAHTITVTNDDQLGKHTYEAYQVFAGDYDATSKKLSNITWGTGVNGTAILNAVKADTTTFGTKAATAATAADVAALLGSGTDTAIAKKFAAIVGANLSSTPAGESTYANDKYTIPVTGDGYYLVQDKDGTVPVDSTADEKHQGDAYTRFILNVVADVTVAAKSETVQSEKKIDDVNDSTGVAETLRDSADYDIGDHIPYTLTATLPANYGEFNTYYLEFVDDMSKGLTLDANSVKIYYGAADTTGTAITFATATGTSYTGGQKYSYKIEDLKTTATGLAAGDKVTIKYTATLNTNAVIGEEGNPNKYHIVYSNNPNNQGDGDKGTTPDDVNIAFTFDIEVDKVIGGTTTPLKGAAFALYKLYKTVPEGKTAASEIKYDNGTKTYTIGTGEKWVLVDQKTAGDASEFTFTGVDDGTYLLVETTTPSGYNSIAPAKFQVTAEHSDGADPALTSITGTKTDDSPTPVTLGTLTRSDKTVGLQTKIENNEGSTLPATGGRGTMIFYVIGGILVLAAAIILISRRRVQQ